MKFVIENFEQNNCPDAMNEFLNYLTTIRGKSPNTVNAYRTDLTLFFKFLMLYKGKVPNNTDFDEISIKEIDKFFLRGITLSDLYAFIAFVEKYRHNGSYAKARKVATLKSFFKYLVGKARIIDENPALELESPKINKRNPIYLTLDESRKLLLNMDETSKNYYRDYCIITLFLNCGMRLSELCSININEIKGDTLSIIGKGNKERTIYLNTACLRAIEDYLRVRDGSKLPPEDKNALFVSAKNQRINKRTVERLVKKYTNNAGLEYNKYTPHKLRHTAATLMYKHGSVDIRNLQKLLGHESIATTQIYTHVDDEKLREAVNSNPLKDL